MKYLLARTFLVITLLGIYSHALIAQEMVLVVERCKALDQSSPIHNIWVDEENIKWVANSQGLFKVLALDLVQKASVGAGKTSLLNIRGGNAKLEWSTAEMQALLGNPNIQCASYDPKTKSVWIGTRDKGAFQVSLSPLRILQQLNTDNKKLTSNQINDIFIQPNGTIWVATNDGMLTGDGSKWSLQERYLNFIGVDAWGNNLWILGDDFLWQVDSRGKWNAVAIEPRNVEGQLRDIAVDDEGRVWIASNMMTGYNAEQLRYQRFGPGQYFTSQFVNCLDVDQDGSIWTGTDDKGLYLIQWEAAMTVNILTDTPLDCKSKNPTAALSTKVTGGTEPFQYKWSNGQTTPKVSQLGPGQYTLTVTDANNVTKTVKYEIPDPNLKLTMEMISACSDPVNVNGSANVLVDGGNLPFQYKWDNGEIVQTATKLSSGTHQVTVTDASGCAATGTVDIQEKVLPLVVFAKFLSSNTCAESKNGVAEVEINGGKAPFTITWSPNVGTTQKVSGLGSGLYTATVTDANGQSTSTSVNIPAPALLQANIIVTAQASANQSNGQAEVKTNGGTAPFSYRWDNGEAHIASKTLSAGLHTVTVTDANGCTVVASTEMSENITSLGVIIKQPVKISCNGNAGASLKVEITGGKSPYTYVWNDGQTSLTAEGLRAGNYNVTVTDAAGNTHVAAYKIDEPPVMVVTVTADAAASTNQADGKASVKASGGSGGYTYKWDNGETGNKAVALSPGTHIVTVSDNLGCAVTGSVEITEDISGLQVSITEKSKIRCAGGNDAGIEATIRGGKSPYNYTWSNGAKEASLQNLTAGKYQVTITDAAGQSSTAMYTVEEPASVTLSIETESIATQNKADGRATASVAGGTGRLTIQWSNGESGSKAITLGAGKHTIRVTDENGCSAESEILMLENIQPISIQLRQTADIKCFGAADASAIATVSGGKLPHQMKWKNQGQEWNGESLNNVKAGSYQFEVTDAAGIVATSVLQITQPEPLGLAIDQIIPANVNAADGKVILTAKGGTAQYSSDGTTWPAGTNTFTIDRLKAGNHKIVVKDAMGCVAEIPVTMTEDITPVSVSIDVAQMLRCAGSADGHIEAKVKGGKEPYVYTWSNGSKSAALQNLTAGEYTITVNDATGQSGNATVNIKAPAPLTIKLSNLRSATNDRINDGKANAEVTGGTGNYTYVWNSGETFHQATKLPLGPGNIVITDENGCTARADFEIKEKVLPELTASRIASGEPLRLEKIQFQADSINVNEDAKPSLDELYEFLYDNPTVIIEVAGHTNGLPADEYCDRISTERANAVANYIIQKGVEGRRVIAKGYGKRKPIATNQTAEGRKRNQRVEIRLIKIEE